MKLPKYRIGQTIWRTIGILSVPRYISGAHWNEYLNQWMYGIMCSNTGFAVWFGATENDIDEKYTLERVVGL